MRRTFEKPGTGDRETVDVRCALGALAGGIVFLVYKRLWAHVMAWPVIVVLPALLAGNWMLAWLLPLVSGAYALGMQDVLANHYLDSGWIEVFDASTD